MVQVKRELRLVEIILVKRKARYHWFAESLAQVRSGLRLLLREARRFVANFSGLKERLLLSLNQLLGQLFLGQLGAEPFLAEAVQYCNGSRQFSGNSTLVVPNEARASVVHGKVLSDSRNAAGPLQAASLGMLIQVRDEGELLSLVGATLVKFEYFCVARASFGRGHHGAARCFFYAEQ